MSEKDLQQPLPPDARQCLNTLINEACDMSVALGQLLNKDVTECLTAVQELRRALDNRLAECVSLIHTSTKEEASS